MNKVHERIQELWKLPSEQFEALALQVFNYQAKHTLIYKKFLQLLDVYPENIKTLNAIPFLPIEVYRNHKVIVESANPEKVFESSGTTNKQHSKHFVANLFIYDESITHCFNQFYGAPDDYCILALLPSYLERKNASLVYMCQHLMERSGCPDNGFYLDNLAVLAETIKKNEITGQNQILIGVSFALLDFAALFPMELKRTIIIETGGMKGRRDELTREELHHILKNAFGLKNIHSEYGMTELLSQSYSLSDGIFHTPPWMRILIRDAEDPFTMLDTKRNGLINIIDLANIYSCSFIATQDTGVKYPDESFRVTGRFDNADVRGCNLMVL